MLELEYKICEEDSREALQLWLDENAYRALSDEERNTIDVLVEAEKLGRWPVTVGEVEEFLKRDNEDYWMSRFGRLPPQ
jgi:hypothetical protein